MIFPRTWYIDKYRIFPETVVLPNVRHMSNVKVSKNLGTSKNIQSESTKNSLTPFIVLL